MQTNIQLTRCLTTDAPANLKRRTNSQGCEHVAAADWLCRILDLNGYIRIDLRLTPDGALYVLEANPNPGIASYEEATKSAEKAGINYPQFIQRIVMLGLQGK